jgi:hypothetical protein
MEEAGGLDHDHAGSAAIGMAIGQPEQGHRVSLIASSALGTEHASVRLGGWENARNALISQGHFCLRLGKNRNQFNVGHWTLNQRVQGSSPCAPTNEIKRLSYFTGVTATQQRRSGWRMGGATIEATA